MLLSTSVPGILFSLLLLYYRSVLACRTASRGPTGHPTGLPVLTAFLGDQGSVKVLPGAASRGTWRESVRALPEGAGSSAAKSVSVGNHRISSKHGTEA